MDIGTMLFTWLNGDLVGKDEFGNQYYRSKGRKLSGRERRWVMFKNKKEPSQVPPEWHAWLHHTVDTPLTEEAAQAKAWQKAHEENPTGTADAYRPLGHDYLGGHRARATGDYEPWTPS